MVPNGWTKGTIEDIAKVTSGGTPSRAKDSYWNGHIPWVTTSEVKFGVIADAEQKITQEGLDNSSAKLFPKDTILMAMYGQGKTRGQVAKLGIEASTNQACAALLLHKEHDVEYYYQFLTSQYENIRDLANSGGQQNLSAGIIKGIHVPIPPLPEQQKISKILSTWDKAICTTEKLIATSKQQKKALMQQLLTGKKRLLNPETGKQFEGDWKEVKVGQLIVKHSEKTVRNKQYPVLTSSRKGIFFQSDYYNDRDVASEDTTGYNVVPRGYFTYRHMSDDLVFKFNINTICDRGIVSTLYPVFATKDNLVSRYLFQSILNNGNEFKNFSLSQKQGGSRTYMYLSKLNELKLNLPNLEEQQKIASVLTCADKKIIRLEVQLAQLKQEKKALMQQLLTGKLRVKVDLMETV
tara:strand:- start:2217 stop:3440 length:1224 start_codon:yes stop_codon:yes gene_type:complete